MKSEPANPDLETPTCLRKLFSGLLNERRVCKLLGYNPDQLHQEADSSEFRILQVSPLIRLNKASLAYDAPGSVSFEFKAIKAVQITLFFNLAFNGHVGEARCAASAIPQQFKGGDERQRYSCDCKNVGEAVKTIHISVAGIGDCDESTVSFQLYECEMSNGVAVLNEIVKVGADYYEMQRVFGAPQTPFSVTSQTHAVRDGQEVSNCCVCLAEGPTVAAMPCRHLVLCSECAESFRTKAAECPLCRAPINLLIDLQSD